MRGRVTFAASLALLVTALAVGGAGENYPILEMLLDLVAIAVAASLIWRRPPGQLPPLSRWAVALLGGIMLLPLVQLIPLPPGLWDALPGRELPAQVDEVLGVVAWRPVTLDVEGTIRAFLSLLPPSVLFLACLWLRTPERIQLILIIAIFALVNAILGMVQVASGGAATPYASSHIGYPIGLFVNRNHNAAFLLVSMPVVATLAASRARQSASKLPWIVAAIALLVVIAIVIVATTSRMALLLLPLAFAGALGLLFFRQRLLRTAVPVTLVLGAIIALMSWLGGFSRNLDRFSSLHEARLDYWNDMHWALGHYGLAGTGFGTFVPVYETAESLAGVSPAVLNHAHNDFIELVLDGGAPAIILIFLFFVLLAFAAARLMRGRHEPNRGLLTLAAAFGIVLVLGFSLVDYPLRMPAISCAFAVLCACLLPSPEMSSSGPDLSSGRSAGPARLSRYIRRSGEAATLLVLSIFVVEAGVSRSNLLADRYDDARQWAPWSTAAHSGLADEALGAMRKDQARDEALSALRLSPIDVAAVRTAAMLDILNGSSERGRRLMEVAVALGWRDPMTQLWAIAASEQANEPRTAVTRAQALFQQQLYPPASLALLLRDAPDGPTAAELMRTLESRPSWRSAFFSAAARLPAAYLARLSTLAFRIEEGKAPLSLEEARPLIDRLIAAGDLARAQQLWIGTHRTGLIANGDFEELSSRSGAEVPSDWDISDEDLATIAIQTPPFAGHGRALRISSAARSGPILSQRLMLEPGSYVLSYRARSGAGGSGVLEWELGCADPNESQTSREAPASDEAWQEFEFHFTVPVRDCRIQTLALRRPDAIHSREIWLDQLVLRPGG